MGTKIAINGFGRIGRQVFRLAAAQPDIQIVAINDLVSVENLAYLLQYDSTHGRFSKDVSVEGDAIVVDGFSTQIFSEKDPSKLPWGKLGVDVVIEATGHFCDLQGAEKHLQGGAKRVVISAPAKSAEIPTYVVGVNHEEFNPGKDRIVSNASCTTNCLAPITKVLLDEFGIVEGLMTTVHAATATQPTVDGPSPKDLRGGRGASQNIIPASTGAAKAVGLCIPQVKGKLTGMAFRVPISNVSVVDLTVRVEKNTTYEGICDAMRKASQGKMKGILSVCEEPLVSSDFNGSSFSSIFDVGAGIALNDNFFKVISWYDNEVGYSCRILDLILFMTSKEQALTGQVG